MQFSAFEPDMKPAPPDWHGRRVTTMATWTWDPLREMDALRREIDRLFDGIGLGWSRSGNGPAWLSGPAARVYPYINIKESEDHLEVEALAPGVDPESLNVSVVKDQLTISGNRVSAPEQIKPEAFHRRERTSGRFVRTFELPVEIDADKVSAEYRNGLLKIRLPKAEAARPRRIEVKAA